MNGSILCRENCKNLWQQSYQDCTEERALGELCGYPLCDNPVASPNQKMPKYKICLRTKKVSEPETAQGRGLMKSVH